MTIAPTATSATEKSLPCGGCGGEGEYGSGGRLIFIVFIYGFCDSLTRVMGD